MSLQVLTNFPGGNANVQEITHTPKGDEIEFSAESKRHEPQPLWFNFCIQRSKSSRVRCILTNPSQCLKNYKGWITNAPVYWAGAGPWLRVNKIKKL